MVLILESKDSHQSTVRRVTVGSAPHASNALVAALNVPVIRRVALACHVTLLSIVVAAPALATRVPTTRPATTAISVEPAFSGMVILVSLAKSITAKDVRRYPTVLVASKVSNVAKAAATAEVRSSVTVNV
jgi:hypothetical protein